MTPEARGNTGPRTRTERLTGWGRYPSAETTVYRPGRVSRLDEILRASGPLVARGRGRSYGDASFLGSGATVDMTRLDRLLSFDPGTGVLEAEAGVTLEDLIAVFVPRGYFPPVTPGTRHVTLGGCLACDVHGKNHHVSGSFGRHVTSFTLLTGEGEETIEASSEENADVFHATLGGMGLTGIVTSVALRLKPIETAFLRVEYERTPGIEATMDRLAESDDRFEYSVAWIDCLTRGARLGRSVLMRANPATRSDLPDRLASNALEPPSSSRLAIPVDFPSFMLNRYSVRLFNALYYRSFPQGPAERLVHFDRYFYPLDGIERWNRMYGKRGLIQYQCVLPEDSAPRGLRQILDDVSRHGSASFLAVLKRFGGGVDHVPSLSFPMRGYTLSLDLPRGAPGLADLLTALDRTVEAAGGRVYLAKDSRLSPEMFERMYPDSHRWKDVKARVDPDARFRSDLAERLGLVP